MTDLDLDASTGEENPPFYIVFLLVFLFFGTGLLGFLVCHLLKKKGYRCRTRGEEDEEDEEEEQDVEEKLALPEHDEEQEDHQDTVEQILKCIIENEANMEAFKEMLGNQNICERHDPRLLRKESQVSIPPHHHTVHSGSGSNSCHLCVQGRTKKARQRSRAARAKAREQTVFSVGRFRVTHTDKKPGLQGSTNLPTAESGEQLDQSEPLDSEKGEESHRKEGFNLRNMFKDVKPESTNNGVVPSATKRRKSLTLFSLRRGSDPQGLKVTRAHPPTVLEEPDPARPGHASAPSPTPSQAPTSTPSPAPTPSPTLAPVPAPSPNPSSAHSAAPRQTSTPPPPSAKSPAPTPPKSPAPNPGPPFAPHLPAAPGSAPGTPPGSTPPSARSPAPSPAPASSPARAPTPAKSLAPTPSPPSTRSLAPASSPAPTSTRASPDLARASPGAGSPVTPGVQGSQGDTGGGLTSVSAGPASPRATPETGRIGQLSPAQGKLGFPWSPGPIVSFLPASPSSPSSPPPLDSTPLGRGATVVKASPDSSREFSVVRMVELEGEGPSVVREGLTVQGEGLVGKKPAATEECPAAGGEEPAAPKEEPRDEMVQMEDIRGCRVSQGEEPEELEERRRSLYAQQNQW